LRILNEQREKEKQFGSEEEIQEEANKWKQESPNLKSVSLNIQ
jgi:hypothetical protein